MFFPCWWGGEHVADLGIIPAKRDYDIMMLYHASNVEVKKLMLVESNRMLDFGPGFYTTSNREQALRFAKSGGVLMDARRFATYLAVVISPAVVGVLADELGVDEVTAMNKYFASSAYAAISDEGQKLWHHSPQLLASLVEEELRTGSFTCPQEAL